MKKNIKIDPHAIERFQQRFEVPHLDPSTVHIYLEDALNNAVILEDPKYLNKMFSKDCGRAYWGQSFCGPVILIIKEDSNKSYDGVLVTILNPEKIKKRRLAGESYKIKTRNKLLCPKCCHYEDSVFGFLTGMNYCYRCNTNISIVLTEDGHYELETSG